MPATASAWDFFLAHASADRLPAEQLYEMLGNQGAATFLDSRTLLPGDDWTLELPKAQKTSLISVILISQATDQAYYQREEISTAIAMAREDRLVHRAVPVYLGPKDILCPGLPYGMRNLAAIALEEHGGLAGVAQELGRVLQHMKRSGNVPPHLPTPLTPPKQPPTDLSQLAQAPVFICTCIFPGDPVQYRITQGNQIVAFPPGAPPSAVGWRIPSMIPGFAWMYQTPMITYGVDHAGRIWNRAPNGMPFQIGYVTQP